MNWKQGAVIVIGLALLLGTHFLPWPRSRPVLVSTQTRSDGTVVRMYKAKASPGELLSEAGLILVMVAAVRLLRIKRTP